METTERGAQMRLPSRNVRVFLYGNIAGIAGWWQYVVHNGMDQFALGSLQAFVAALASAYMMRKDDDKPGKMPRRGHRPNEMQAHLDAKRQERLRDRASSSVTRFDPPGLTPVGDVSPPTAIPREPRFPQMEARPMHQQQAWPQPNLEKTLPIPPINFGGDER